MSAPTATATSRPEPRVTTWQLDPTHTHVGFTVRHMMFTWVNGKFTEVTGELLLDEADITRSEVRVSVPVASIDTSVAARDEHLRSPDFFAAAEYPAMTFESRRVQPGPDGTLRIIGDLTIRGTTREVVIEAREEGRGTDPWGNARIGFTGETRIDRREFGLRWNQALEAGGMLVGDEIRITLDVQAVSA